MTEPLGSFTERLCHELEIARQREVASHLFHAMGGGLPAEQMDTSQRHTALEVVGGTGEWVLAVAQTSPSIQVGGLDKSDPLLATAQHRAESAGVTTASLVVQDVQTLHAAGFPDQSFDLITMAFTAPVMLTLDYQALVRTLLPLSRSIGMVRWTEMEFPITNSPAFEQRIKLTCRTLQAAGHSFIPPSLQEIAALFARLRSDIGGTIQPYERRHGDHTHDGELVPPGRLSADTAGSNRYRGLIWNRSAPLFYTLGGGIPSADHTISASPGSGDGRGV